VFPNLCRLNDATVVRLLEALRLTVCDELQYVFRDAVERFADMNAFYANITLRNWAWFFQPSFVDTQSVCSKVFAVCSGLVTYVEPTPVCPRCGAPTVFEEDRSTCFGWRYRCNARRWNAKDRRRRHVSCRRCRGSVMPTVNTWFGCSHAIGQLVYLTFLWMNRIRVAQAAVDAGTTTNTAVDIYSLCREVAEVLISHEIRERPFGGEGLLLSYNMA